MKKFFIFVLFLGLFNLNFLNVNTASAGTGVATVDDEINSALGDKSMSTTLCAIMAFVTGNVGKAFAAFAIIFIGVGFLSGKVTWMAMITFAFGLAAIFGAPAVIGVLTGGEAICKN